MKYRWDKKYKYWGMTAFLVLAAAITYTMLLLNLDKVGAGLAFIAETLSGITVGVVIAYLLSPVVNFVERKWYAPLSSKMFNKKPQKRRGFARGLSVVTALLFGFLIVGVLLLMIAPKFVESITMLLNNMNVYLGEIKNWIANIFASDPKMQTTVMDGINSLATGLGTWFETELIPVLSSGIVTVASAVVSVFVGVAVSIYLLFNKEVFVAQMKRIIYAFFPTKWSSRFLRACSFTHKKIAGFISCQLLDSLLVGIITFIAMLILGLGLPYSSLIAVVIGATNFIPFFGPFIGAIPCAFIILLIDPIKAFIFVAFILVMQQIDGNVINPRIHGSNTGMSGFWVIFSITLGGGLFGFPGMVLSVPVFAAIYAGISTLNTSLLKKKGLPQSTKDYMVDGAIATEEKEETEE